MDRPRPKGSTSGHPGSLVRHGRAVPAIHVFGFGFIKTWMPGTRPGMTMPDSFRQVRDNRPQGRLSSLPPCPAWVHANEMKIRGRNDVSTHAAAGRQPAVLPQLRPDHFKPGPTCPHCGAPTGSRAPGRQPQEPARRAVVVLVPGNIRRAPVLCRKVGTGILQLFTLAGLGIWTFVDFIMIIVGAFRDKEGRRVIVWTD